MHEFSWNYHGNEYLMVNSEEFFENVHFLIYKHILQQNHIVAMLSLVILIEFRHFVYIELTSILITILLHFFRFGQHVLLSDLSFTIESILHIFVFDEPFI